MQRRSFLAATGTSLTVFSAGCATSPPTSQQAYAFGLYNGSREAHTFSVRIGNEADHYFQEETFEMDAETANEQVEVTDTPAIIQLRIDSNQELTFPWPASTANPGTIATRAEIWYEPNLEQEVLIESG